MNPVDDSAGLATGTQGVEYATAVRPWGRARARHPKGVRSHRPVASFKVAPSLGRDGKAPRVGDNCAGMSRLAHI